MTLTDIRKTRYDQVQFRLSRINQRLRLGTDHRAQLLFTSDITKLEIEKAKLEAESQKLESQLQERG